MTRKRLTRELKWGIQYFPYHQLWMDNDIYTGWVAINYLTDGEYYYWDFPKAGKVPVAGKGMCWLTLIPKGKSRSITAKFTKDRRVSVWYVDVIDEVKIDEDGVVAFMDKYLDVMFTPEGDITIDDRDELDAAFQSGELSREQYDKSNDLLRDNWKRLHEKLAFYDVTISDVTTCDNVYEKRTDEISAYLSEHTEIKKYAILDDCYSDDYSSDEEIQRHLVFVDALKGLQDADCIQVCKLMNEIV